MIDANRILITGGSGMVGSQIAFGYKPARAELDITDPASVRSAIDRYRPSAIMHLAGLVDMARCEAGPEEAKRLNEEAAAHIAERASAASIPLVYLSTCVVFDGKKDSAYVESDEPSPLTVYGRTKLDGERATLQYAPHALVVRTGWLFGGLEHDTRFVKRLMDSLRAGHVVRATSDRYGSPTYVPDLIAETTRLLQDGASGITHVVNAGIASYFEVAMEIKRLTGSTSLIEPVAQRDLDSNELPRGTMEALASERGIELRPFADALAAYISI